MATLHQVSAAVLIFFATIIFPAWTRAETRGSGGLIGHWPLDEGEGEVAHDRSANVNHGKIKAGYWRKDATGTALEFDGNDTYIVMPHKPCLNIRDELTIETCVCPVSVQGKISFFNKGTGNFPSGYNFLINDGKLGFLARTERAGGAKRGFKHYELYTDTVVVPVDKWTHVAVTYSAAANESALYVNGRLIKKAPAAGGILNLEEYQNLQCAVSGMSLVPHYNYYHLEGFLRELRVYDRALSPEEVAGRHEENSGILKLSRFKTHAEEVEASLTARVDGCVVDAGGQGLNAKVYLQGADGKYYAPKDSFAYGNEGHKFFYAFGSFSAAVPPGGATLLAGQGFEWLPKKVAVPAGKAERVEIKLERLADMSALGWYCGEDELQYCAAHGKGRSRDYFRRLAGGPMPEGFVNACRICQAEGLNWVNFTSNIRYWSKQWDDRMYGAVDTARFTARHGRELRGEYGGDIICVNVPDQKAEGNNQLEQLQKSLAEGGAANLADGGHDIANPRAYLTARLFPIWVMSGRVRLWHHAFLPFGSQGMSDSYRLLNMGFKVAQAAGTDLYMIFSKGEMKPGSPRTYVKLKNLTWPEIADAYRNQRLFATEGPLLMFTINGRDMGETLEIGKNGPEQIQCKLEACSIYGMEKVEIVQNGKVVKTFFPKDGRIKEEFSLTPDGACWIAARAYGKKGDFAGVQAHSAPIYVQYKDQGIQPAAEDIRYFKKWMETLRAVTPGFEKNFKGKTDWIYSLIDEGDAILKSLEGSPRRWTANP
ncbi:MAG: CehA/McbA family metallohydrolase [Verrucomicrobiae bacterium]|nr:CehA/McbA family metallohydrolase [Verrucomicrobiae bacterium]